MNQNNNQLQNKELPKSKMATVSLILGVSSVGLFVLGSIYHNVGGPFRAFYWPLGVITGIAAIFLGFKTVKNGKFNNKSSAIIGIILGTLCMWPILFVVVYIGLMLIGLIEARPLFFSY